MVKHARRTTTAAIALALALTACGSGDDAGNDETTPDVAGDVEDEPEAESEPDPPAEQEPEPGAEDEENAGSDANPYAIGEAATLGDWEVTVTDFVEDATERVLGDNEFNEEPSNGLYATTTFDATYLGDEEGSPGFEIAATLVVDGVQHADSECGASLEGGGMDAPTLENGGTAEDITFCFDHPGINEDATFFLSELMSFDDERAYYDVG